MASHRKGLLPIKIGHIELRKKQIVVQLLPDLLVYLLKCGFSFQKTVMNGNEGYFAMSYRDFFLLEFLWIFL